MTFIFFLLLERRKNWTGTYWSCLYGNSIFLEPINLRSFQGSSIVFPFCSILNINWITFNAVFYVSVQPCRSLQKKRATVLKKCWSHWVWPWSEQSTAGPHHKPAGSIWFRPTFPFQIEISLLKSHRGRKGRGWEGSLSEVRLICLQLVWGAQRHVSSQHRVYSLILNRWVVRVFILAGLQWKSDLNGKRAWGAARGQSSVSGCHCQSVLSPLWVAERRWWMQLPSVWVQRETLSPGTWER